MINTRTGRLQGLILLLLCPPVFAFQPDTSATETSNKIKQGWSFGGVPAIAYDSDLGFLYGAVVEMWDYGDGSQYPLYDHAFYLEYSRATKGSGIAQINYDSPSLIPGLRTIGELSFLTEQALDFYGYNGYQSYYNTAFEDDSENNPDYISRLYYRLARKLLRIRGDFQGRFFSDRAKWLTGITHYTIQLDTIDAPRLNNGKADADKLPYVNGGLYGQYAYQWNLVPEEQINGGHTTLLKTGLIYDTRDNEPNPMKGIWTEALINWAPGFLGNGAYGFGKLSLIHRQYFTLVPERLSFVYRVAWQAKLWGCMPSYMLPLVLNGGTAKDRDGLGGGKTLRGIRRNRVVGEDFIYSNLEFRWKFLRTTLFNQNLYLALNIFSDMGMTTSEYKPNLSAVPVEYRFMFPNKKESLHISYGAGLHIALNENFVIAIDQGFAADPRDGDKGLYIGMKWLF